MTLAVSGCDDDTSEPQGGTGTSDGRSGTTSVGPGSTGGTTAETSSTTGSTTSPSTSGTGGTTTSRVDGCEPAGGLEDILFPLEVGRSWALELGCGSDGNTETWVVTGTQMVGGREAMVLETDFGSGPQTTYWTRVGQQVERWNEGTQAWEVVLMDPIEEGYEWGDVDTYHWEPAGDVTVAAGSYSGCWTVVGCSAPNMCLNEATYCPGIGLVHEVGFEIDYELLGCSPE